MDSLVSPGLVGWAVSCEVLAACIARALERGCDPGEAVLLQAFHLEHPRPAAVAAALAALEIDVAVIEGSQPALVATITGRGTIELR